MPWAAKAPVGPVGPVARPCCRVTVWPCLRGTSDESRFAEGHCGYRASEPSGHYKRVPESSKCDFPYHPLALLLRPGWT